ncbi:YhgE/Pip domain-containing protein [Yaniella flava]|uniref:YhgE/Pip domain-containing protein n=1 Tax=Yaniella flava TaxID=287930 RepID=A0ABN2UB20_9MICC|nr:YhgE/Pip domain-containing protein [Micrococcaceae bacterium]
MSRLNPKVQLTIILTALAVIPLIYATLLVWSVKDPTGSLDVMPAAIVNEDEPATTTEDEELQLGDDLTETLLDSDESFSWTTMDKNTAHDALEAGDVRAVLEIPNNFSSSAASLGDEDPLAAAQSQLTIMTNDASNIIAGNIAGTVGEAVRSSVSKQVGEEFVAQMTVGFTQIGSAIDDAADGAHDLSDGTSSAHTGAGDLVVGLDELTNGTDTLSDGAADLAAGTDEALSGSRELASGLATLEAETQSLPETAEDIDRKAQQLAGGLQNVAADIEDASSVVDTLATDAQTALDDTQILESTSENIDDFLTTASQHSGDITAESQELLDSWDELTDDQRLAAVQAMTDNAQAAQTANENAQEQAQTLHQKVADVVGAETSDGTATGLAGLSTDMTQVQEILDRARTGADRGHDSGQRMHEAADRLTTASGTFVDGTQQLSGAISSAATASSELSTGLETLDHGATALNSGTTDLASGADDARAGAGDLHSGLDQLDTGAHDLAAGLDEGKDDVPRYSDRQSDHLSDTAADPVTLEQQRLHEVDGYGWGLAPYFMGLALWVGAMGYFLMQPAINLRRIATADSRLRAVLTSLTPAFSMAFVQSTLMVTFVRFVVGIDMAQTAGVYALCFFASLTFFIVNQMLIAVLDAPGRFIALVLIVLQLSAAGGTYPIETAPQFLQNLHGWLPLTHVVNGLRSLIAGGTFDTGGVLPPLGLWLLLSLAGLISVVLVTWRKTHRNHGAKRAMQHA